MADKKPRKDRLLKLMELLRRETDEAHPLKTAELCILLAKEGNPCDIRTVSRDIAYLNEQGYEVIERMIGHEKAYHVLDTAFQAAEAKILIDAVQAASFIPTDRSEQLIEKIAALGGKHKARIMKSNLVKFNTCKHSNIEIFDTIEKLEQAIYKKTAITFRYFDLDEMRRRIFRHGEAFYHSDPVALVFNDDNYYYLGYDRTLKIEKTFRVDRMDDVQTKDEKITYEAVRLRNDVSRFTQEAFKMYDGEPTRVTLRFDDSLIGVVYDKFGEQTWMKRLDEHTVTTRVWVRISPTFWGWIFQFAGDMEIVEPEDIRQLYRERAEKIVQSIEHKEQPKQSG